MSIPAFEKGTRVMVVAEPGDERGSFEGVVEDEINVSTDGPHIGWYLVRDDRGQLWEVPGLSVGQLS